MGCLERCDPERTIRCRFCGQKWDGSSLVLGTMYSYDIFMATPCCAERLKVCGISIMYLTCVCTGCLERCDPERTIIINAAVSSSSSANSSITQRRRSFLVNNSHRFL